MTHRTLVRKLAGPATEEVTQRACPHDQEKMLFVVAVMVLVMFVKNVENQFKLNVPPIERLGFLFNFT